MLGNELRSFSIDGLEKIGEGGMGTIYKIDDEQIIKVYHPEVTLSEIEKKKQYVREIFVRGIPTMISFEIVAVGNQYGIIFEMLGSDTVGRTLRKDPSLTMDYGRKMGELLKKIHTVEMPEKTLPKIKDRFSEWIDIMDRDYHTAPYVIQAMRQVLEAVPETNRVLHCDFHEGNVMISGDELLVIDTDEICVGNPIYDLAFCYGNHDLLAYNPKLLENSVGIKPATARQMRRLIMMEYYHTDDVRKIKKLDTLLLILALFTFALSLARLGDSDYATRTNQRIVRYIVHPVFYIMWSAYRLLHKDMFSGILPEDLNV